MSAQTVPQGISGDPGRPTTTLATTLSISAQGIPGGPSTILATAPSSPAQGELGEKNAMTATVSPSPTEPQHQSSALPSNSAQICRSEKRACAVRIGGAVAGSFVGAALIASFLTYWLLRRGHNPRKSSRGSRQHRHRPKANSEDGVRVGLRSQSNTRAAIDTQSWEKHIQQPKDDAFMTSEVQTLFHQIEFHIEGNYQDEERPLNEESYQRLVKLDPTGSQKQIIRMLGHTSSPTVLLKHLLSKLIVAHLALAIQPRNSLLPVEFTSIPYLMQWNMELGQGSRQEAEGKPAFWQAFSRWKALSAYLRPDPASDPTYLKARDAAISAMLENILVAFSPWTRKGSNEEQCMQNLGGILRSAAEVGISIFSQRSIFGFNWAPYAVPKGTHTIVVTPEFCKVTDEVGNPLDPPQILVKMTMESISVGEREKR